jgi:hypothetical protein
MIKVIEKNQKYKKQYSNSNNDQQKLKKETHKFLTLSFLLEIRSKINS